MKNKKLSMKDYLRTTLMMGGASLKNTKGSFPKEEDVAGGGTTHLTEILQDFLPFFMKAFGLMINVAASDLSM